MRVTFKVAAAPCDMKKQDGDMVIHPIRGVPYGDKTEMEREWMNEVVERYDQVMKLNEKEQAEEITPAMHRRTNRAARYDDWCYVRFECRQVRGGKIGVQVINSISIDNVNHLEGATWEMVRKAATDCARFIAQMIVTLVYKTTQVKDPRFADVFVWDKDNEFFAWAQKDHEDYLKEKESKRVDALVEKSRSSCPHVGDGNRCLIHTKGCPYFENGLCGLEVRK